MGSGHDSLAKSACTPATTPQDSVTEPLEELRHLILGPEQAQLRQLEERLDNFTVSPVHVSQVLPEAVRHRAHQDHQLATALLPVVEEAIQASVRAHPRIIVETLFPLMGPAIRRAVAHRLRSMLASFNQALGVSLSLRGVKWRVEALRTGVSFTEVVLLHTLRYRIEHVFLIHRHTGLLLQHVTDAALPALDTEMIAAMLTAIQDFVRESFGVPEDEGLDIVQVGELTVLVEQGSLAILACIVRGTAPSELKPICEDALAQIHSDYWQELLAFTGDATAFEGTRRSLEVCIQADYKAEERPMSRLWWGWLAILVCGLGWWSISAMRADQRWSTYLETLRTEPGIIVTTAEKRGGRYRVVGLRDPLAADPGQLLRDARLAPLQVVSRWQPYLALEPAFVLVRAKTILEPPDTVRLQLEGDVLTATGAASHPWIHEALRLARAIPGVRRFDVEQVVDLTRRELLTLKEAVEQYNLHFVKDTTHLLPGQETVLDELIVAVQKLFKVAQQASYEVQLHIIGHTDKMGSEERNRPLSRERAERILAILTSHNITNTPMQAMGVGSMEPLRAELVEADREQNRRVTVRVVLPEISGK